MASKWIGAILFVAVIMAILGATSQGMTLSMDPETTTMDPDIDVILHYAEAWQDADWGTLVSPIQNAEFFKAMFHIVVMQQSLHAVFPEGSPWMWFWIILWVPIMGTIIFGLLMLFFSILQRNL